MTGVPRFYLTTAIDYANGDPHLGHAFEKIGADAIARFHRLAGHDVHFLIGMDEHGQKVAQTAAARGVEPQALVDELAARFRALWSKLDISNTRWVRTTPPTRLPTTGQGRDTAAGPQGLAGRATGRATEAGTTER